MKVDWKESGDADQLKTMIAEETRAKPRDRYRVVLLAGGGLGTQAECSREQIAAAVGRSRQFVDQWVVRYRRQGLAGLQAKKQPGAKPKLTAAEQQELLLWLERGPSPEEKLAAYNGPILREKIHTHFGKLYALSAVYALLHRLGYNDLMPRPAHPDTDPEVVERFKKKSFPKRWRKSRQIIPPNAS